ncbi:MAG: hypothetical protein KIH69_001950 [Anaerolineae bacterium]|nr:hypothetical protein [Anaerolineae bacterium]
MLTTEIGNIWRIRTVRKDVGVGIVVALAFFVGLLVREYIETRAEWFIEQGTPFRIAYPVTWGEAISLQSDALLKIEDLATGSTYKTNLVVQRRDLDPAAAPTIQTLLDRRVEERGKLTAYHFLGSRDLTLAGAKAVELNYAFVAQPLDQPRRASLPVVVQTRDIIIVAKDRSYYLTLSAPEVEYERASAKFDQMLSTLRVD